MATKRIITDDTGIKIAEAIENLNGDSSFKNAAFSALNYTQGVSVVGAYSKLPLKLNKISFDKDDPLWVKVPYPVLLNVKPRIPRFNFVEGVEIVVRISIIYNNGTIKHKYEVNRLEYIHEESVNFSGLVINPYVWAKSIGLADYQKYTDNGNSFSCAFLQGHEIIRDLLYKEYQQAITEGNVFSIQYTNRESAFDEEIKTEPNEIARVICIYDNVSVEEVENKIGDLSQLQTSYKTSIVGAINSKPKFNWLTIGDTNVIPNTFRQFSFDKSSIIAANEEYHPSFNLIRGQEITVRYKNIVTNEVRYETSKLWLLNHPDTGEPFAVVYNPFVLAIALGESWDVPDEGLEAAFFFQLGYEKIAHMEVTEFNGEYFNDSIFNVIYTNRASVGLKKEKFIPETISILHYDTGHFWGIEQASYIAKLEERINALEKAIEVKFDETSNSLLFSKGAKYNEDTNTLILNGGMYNEETKTIKL